MTYARNRSQPVQDPCGERLPLLERIEEACLLSLALTDEALRMSSLEDLPAFEASLKGLIENQQAFEDELVRFRGPSSELARLWREAAEAETLIHGLRLTLQTVRMRGLVYRQAG